MWCAHTDSTHAKWESQWQHSWGYIHIGIYTANKSMLCFYFGFGFGGRREWTRGKKEKNWFYFCLIKCSGLSIHICALLSSPFCRQPASRDTLRLDPSVLSALACMSCQPPSHDSSWFLPLPNVQAHLLHSHLPPSRFQNSSHLLA